MKRSRRHLLLAVGIIAAGGAGIHWLQPPDPPLHVVGMVRQTEIHIAPEVGGRLADISVTPGQHVAQGDILAVIDNPDLSAALGEAEAALAGARAEHDRVFAGVRVEEIEIAAGAVRTAEARLTLARQQNARVAALAQRGFASRAQLDQSNAALTTATADLELRRQQWAAAKAGPVVEERSQADAKVGQAEATVMRLRARLDKTRLIAPVAGTIGLAIVEAGEVLTPGKPVLTLMPEGGLWLAFTMREDALRGLDIGSEPVIGMVGGASIRAIVTELRPLGEFATWRAARAVGDHDLNSFSVRLDPVGDTRGLRPGMTALLDAGPRKR